MADFIDVAGKDDLANGKGKVVEVNGRKIALFNIDGDFFAIDNACRHSEGPLGEGDLQGNTVVCPLHEWEYDVKTGECSSVPGIKVDKYEVKVEDGRVKVKV